MQARIFSLGWVECLIRVRGFVLSEHLIFNFWVIIGNLAIDQTDVISYFSLGFGVFNKSKGVCTNWTSNFSFVYVMIK